MTPRRLILILPLLVMFVSPRAMAQESGAAVCSESKARWMTPAGESATSVASENFDAGSYRLDITIDMEAQAIAGVVGISGRAAGTPMASLVLDLSPRMAVSRVLAPPFADGDTLQFSHDGYALTVYFPVTVQAGQALALEVYYSGQPDPDVFVFGERNGASYAWTFSQPYDAREWWPCKDHPSDKADSVHVRVNVPDSLRVGSQGNLWYGGPVGGGRALFEWHSSFPIATYLVSIAAGEYVEYNDVYTRPPALATEFGDLALPLLHYLYDDGLSALPDGWARTGEAMEVMENWFGPYPFPGEKYGHAEWTRSGAMEHQTMTSMGSFSTTVMVHELAHQWFGDKISPRSWVDLWLSEGFATYSEYLYWQTRTDEPATARIVLENMMDNATRAEGTLVLEDTTNVVDMFDPTRVYAKGGAVLHMLRAVVGDAALRNILRDYAADPDYAYGTATTRDFQSVAEAEYGAPLTAFFRQWVTEGTGYPRYRIASHLKTHGDTKVFITLEQIQTAAQSNVITFEMPVTFAVTTSQGEERFTVQNNQRFQEFVLDVEGVPSKVVFDPDLDLLRDVDFEVKSAVIGAVPAIERVAPNPISAFGEVRLVLPDANAATVTLYDVAGRRVRELAPVRGAGPHSLLFEAGGLASGVYFLRVDGPAGGDVHKVTVVH